MLLTERMKQTRFSDSENQVVDYILTNPVAISDMTIKELAGKTFVHPSTLIRIAKKMGFPGWSDLKEAYLQEQDYLRNHFTDLDANFPFAPNDGLMTIAAKMAALETDTINDTLSLLHHDDLRKATNLLLRAQQIYVFGSNANTLISQDFALKMNRIGRRTRISSIMGESTYEAYNLNSKDCAILISYTGENKLMLDMARIMQEKNVPLLVLTSIGDNQLAKIADAPLRITTRERLYSKIGNFTINTSIIYLLDTLYSCVFAEDYQRNSNHLIEMGELIDHRQISSEIMAESPDEFGFRFIDSFRPN